MSTFTVETVVDAPADRVWAALADIGEIHVWNPGLVDSHVEGDQATGVGAARHCDLGGRNYLKESVVEWKPGHALTMRIVETSLPFDSADIRFRLEPADGSTRITCEPEYRLRFGPIGSLLDALYVRRTYRKGMQELLASLKRHVETADQQTP